MKTLLLDTETWDLLIDLDGNIAVASDPYSLAQDAASAMRTFLGEVYYNTTLGIPYFEEILGHSPPVSYLKAKLQDAAMTVPGVVAAQAFISSWTDRKVTGQVLITNQAGITIATGF